MKINEHRISSWVDEVLSVLWFILAVLLYGHGKELLMWGCVVMGVSATIGSVLSAYNSHTLDKLNKERDGTMR